MKAAIMPQTPKGDLSISSANGMNNAVAMTPTPSQAANFTGTPIRSRNQFRLDKQTDDKLEVSFVKGKSVPKPPEEFYKDLQQFHERRATPMRSIPRITGQEVDLHRLYCEVTERGGFQKVNMRDEWDDILPYLGWKEKIVNGSAGLKYVYRRYLEKYERLSYFGEDPDKAEAMEAADMAEIMGISSSARGGRGTSRYPTSMFGNTSTTSVAMSYNYKQHHVNMDKRRHFKLSTDMYRPSPYEKLMLSLLSPLPNEQDFAINACTLMANESKYVFKLNEYPKLLDALLAHTGVFSDYPMRKLFEHIYNGVRHHSLLGFWRDLLYDRPQILDLYMDEQAVKEMELFEGCQMEKNVMEDDLWNCRDLDFLNLGRGMGKEDYVGQRILQVTAIFRNLSFFEENVPILVKNKTFLRFLVMGANVRWSNIHIQALEIAGNIASEIQLLDPSVDEFSRCLMSTISDGVESTDRAVIINCLEILYKLCQKDSNEDYVLKCLPSTFYNTVALFLPLNDLMLLIFSLEAIYALTSLGSRPCHSILQIRGIIDQLVSLISIKAQTYSPEGCILMRVVEKLPGNIVPIMSQPVSNTPAAAVNSKINHSLTPAQQLKPQTVATGPTMADIVEGVPAPSAVVVAASNQDHIPSQASMPNYTHEDEQYALSWLGITFERTTNPDSHIEQQELYRMYLSHCQKAGKHSVVNHLHFPRLVRLLFNNTVGPVTVRKVDGTEIPGQHYVTIRVRAQPLISQQKPIPATNSPGPKQGELNSPIIKSKIKNVKSGENACGSEKTVPADNKNKSAAASEVAEIKADKKAISEMPKTYDTVDTKPEKVDSDDRGKKVKSQESVSDGNFAPESSGNTEINLNALGTTPSTQSSMIKSLLANKVNQRQQKQQNTAPSTIAVNLPSQQPIKVASTDISALVNNPLMQNTPVKVGQTTIKPINPQIIAEKKISESTPPPLAPLSGSNVTKERPILVTNQKMDKSTLDATLSSNIASKRKCDEPNSQNKRMSLDSSKAASKDTAVTPSKNAANLYAEMAASILEDEDLEEFSSPATASTSQQMGVEQTMQHQSSLLMQQKMPQPTGSMQRQLVFQSNQPPQLKLTHTSSGTTAQQIPNAMATIKTDQGLQTVPVILQQKPLESSQPQSQIIQQVIQPTPPPQAPTQYVLATNQQGQTYLVAQQTQPQPPPPQQQSTQTVLVTQTPQQQTTGAKTIIILQQQHTQPQQIITTTASGQTQKMIMTTPQGQQVLVTQRPQTPQQIYINQQTGSASHLTHASAAPARQIIQTTQQQGHSQLQAGQISPSLLNQLNQIPATIKLHQPIAQPPPTSKLNIPKGGPLSIVQAPTNPTTPVAIPQLQQHQSIIQQHIISGPSEKRHVILGGGRAIEIKETLITPAQPPVQQCQLNSQTVITTQQTGVSTQPLMPQPHQQQVQQTIRAVLEQHQHPSIIQQKISTYNAMPSQSVSSAQPGHLIQVTMSPSPTISQAPALLAAKASEISSSSLVQSKPISTPQPSLPTVILPGGSANQTVFKKGVLAGPPTLIKPSLPTVKLPTTTASGPPPLAAVTNVPSFSTNPQLPISQNNPASQSDSNNGKRDDSQKPSNTPVITNASPSTTSTNSASTQISANIMPTAASSISPAANPQMTQQPQQQPIQPTLSAADMQWLYICDWRNCPRKKFKSLSDLQHHVCTAHAPDHLDISAQIFCQWGVGPGLCDGVPRKRFCLMTHLLDRHLTTESLRAAAQRRIATGMHNIAPTKPTVTIVRNIEPSQQTNTPSPSPSTSSSSSWQTMIGPSALKAITRHNADFINSSEFMDEKEGPVTKSIRLTAALILRNLVMFTTTAKRGIRRHEAHLSNIALSNVEASATVSNILYEMNN